MVNGRPWQAGHPEWNTPGAHIDKPEANACGQTNTKIPNAESTRKTEALFNKVYWFDISHPVCGAAQFFNTNEQNASRVNYQGGWINKPIYVQFECNDKYSGCKDSNRFSERVPVSFGFSTVQVSFGDKVENNKSVQCSLGADFKPYKYDATAPEDAISVADAEPTTGDSSLPTDNDGTQKKPKTEGKNITKAVANKDTVYLFAGTKDMTIDITDLRPADVQSEGVSGLKSITFTSVSKDGANKQACALNQNNIAENSNPTENITKNFTVRCDYTKAGEYTFDLTYEDQAGNKIEKKTTVKIVPNNDVTAVVTGKAISSEPQISNNQQGVFANNSDKFDFTLHFEDSHGNRIYDKEYEFAHPENIYKIEGNKRSGSALSVEHNNNGHTDKNGTIGLLSIKSIAPGKLEDFNVKLPRWDERYINEQDSFRNIDTKEGQEYVFLPLYKATMDMVDDEGIIFGQTQSLKFTFDEKQTKDKPKNVKVDVLNGVMTDKADEWTMTHSGGLVDMPPKGGDRSVTQEFTAEQIGKVTKTPKISATPRVKYVIDNQEVEYHIGAEFSVPVDPLTLEKGGVNKIFVGGQEQSQGKQEFVSDTTKVGNNSWVTARNAVTREIAELTRNRQADGKVINGVKYVSGNQTLSGEVNGSYKTLIVEDGDVTFDNNFNTAKENIAIILVRKNDQSKSNVYVKPNVAFISAFIFAEGSMESVNDGGEVFMKSDRARSQTLSKQIVFHGGIYARNTIGGAVKGTTGEYILPGGRKTLDMHDAVRYDLSFLRMNSKGKDDDNHTKK